MPITKEQDPKYENLPKIETNTRQLHFSPKSIEHNFQSFCCCFPSIWLKNITLKSLSFGTKTPKRYKLTHDDLFLHLNHAHIIFYDFNVVSHLNTWWLFFAPKPYSHHFRSFYCCFLPIWLKIAQNKRTGPYIQKPTKNKNQPQITTFFTQIFCT